MDKSILKRSVLVIGLVALIALMGCGDCPPDKLCCGGEECGDASEGKSCCGSLCPCTGTASKCCTGGPNANGKCCEPNHPCVIKIEDRGDPPVQYNVWSCALCADGQKQCGQVCIGNAMCCTGGVAGCPLYQHCESGSCVADQGTCGPESGACVNGGTPGGSCAAANIDACGDVPVQPCIQYGTTVGYYGCSWTPA